MTDRKRDRVARYLEGDLTTAEAAELEAEARARPELAAEIEAERRLFDALGAAPDVDPEAFTAGVRAKLSRPRRPALSAGAVALAAVALIGVGVAGRATLDGEPAPQPRGKAIAPDKWMGISAFELTGDAPARLGATMARHDELLVAYTNLGPRPARYLLVFGVDAEGEVRWYHPAWTDPDADPTAVPIEAGVAELMLEEAIAHDLPAGPLTLHGVFLDTPMGVRAAEQAIVEGHLTDSARAEHVLKVQVQ